MVNQACELRSLVGEELSSRRTPVEVSSLHAVRVATTTNYYDHYYCHYQLPTTTTTVFLWTSRRRKQRTLDLRTNDVACTVYTPGRLTLQSVFESRFYSRLHLDTDTLQLPNVSVKFPPIQTRHSSLSPSPFAELRELWCGGCVRALARQHICNSKANPISSSLWLPEYIIIISRIVISHRAMSHRRKKLLMSNS